MPLNAKLACSVICVTLLMGMPVTAQDSATRPAAATESVTVTGLRDAKAAVSKFVRAMTVPTRAAGKLARWKEGVCPIAVGVRPEIGLFLIKRVMDVALQTGAPVNSRIPCPPNIEIIFTADPQALLDNIRIMHPILLGPYDNSAQAERLATVHFPIQALYGTASVDLHGQVLADGGRKGGVTMTMVMPPAGIGGPPTAPDMVTLNMPDASTANVTGNRLGDGVSSAITNVVIVADTKSLLNREIGVLADYIALLALSQIQPPDSCQDLPTVLNLLVPDCSRTASALTSGDIAYLRALYKVTPTATFHGQQDEMMYQMDQILGVQR